MFADAIAEQFIVHAFDFILTAKVGMKHMHDIFQPREH